MTNAEHRERSIFGRELTGLEAHIREQLYAKIKMHDERWSDFTEAICDWLTAALDRWCAVEAFEERAAMREGLKIYFDLKQCADKDKSFRDYDDAEIAALEAHLKDPAERCAGIEEGDHETAD